MFLKNYIILVTSFHTKVPTEDFLAAAAKPEAAKLKRKATLAVHSSEEEGELDKPEKARKGAAPEKDTSVIFGPV